MLQWCALLFLFVIPELTEAGAIFFPGDLDHVEGDACTTNTGRSGTCSLSCERSSGHGEPRRCGIKDSRFLFCCDATSGPAEPLVDIAPPRVSFQCGANLKNGFLLPEEAPAKEAPPPPVYEYEDYPTNLTGFPPFFQQGPFAAVGAIDAGTNAWPWMTLVGRSGPLSDSPEWFCGGVLINQQWVLTAQHCLSFGKIDLVRLGEHDYNNDYDFADHEDFVVAETVLYPDYKLPEAYHDLALLRLESELTLMDHIKPVCLPWGTESDKDITGNLATLTGWGDTEFNGFPSTILQEVNVTVFPQTQCDRGYSALPHYPSTWPRGIGQDILCAGDPDGGRDACQGDSGGPLVTQDASGRFVLAGIISKGYGCGHKDYPGLYVNLRYPPYLAWIKKVAFGI